MYSYQSHSPEETLMLGHQLANLLQGEEIIALEGELGTGKTLFAKGLIQGLGVNDDITSPTFTIIHEYYHMFHIYHMDLYRINDVEDLYDLGIEDYLYGEGVKIIEWPEIVKSFLPPHNLQIHLTQTSETGRLFTLIPYGERYERLLKELLGYADTES